ncbi:hypothetical protein CCY99_00575 [Helicobacter sp. 16-1353]|uniref:tetratricopeptide repeat protein n=1 Tax=Helicobacter sp. 16-1353 TaxID=2004996 RepID=UPI000DCDD937|nr:SEL1-like repeat protein [Helicobacter sp. 16-1353]RAX55227.1 hypothetical protein CCY99_00575 [Helicobacter sp. 16-1353]
MKKIILGLLVALSALAWGDDSKVTEFYKKACDKQHGKSCFYLGAMYYKGKGVRQDYSKAKEYFGKACDLGSQDGCDEYRDLNN